MKPPNLQAFLADERIRNIWIVEKHISVYVRRGVHYINEELKKCFDIANIEVDEDYQGKGIFTKFLGRVEQAAKERNLVVYIENILEPRLVGFFERRGYARDPRAIDLLPCFFKIFLDKQR